MEKNMAAKESMGRLRLYSRNLLSNIASLLVPALISMVGFLFEGQTALFSLAAYVIIGTVLLLRLNIAFCRRAGTSWFILQWLFMLLSATICYFVQHGITLAMFGENSKNLFVPVFAEVLLCVLVTAASIVVQIVMAVKKGEKVTCHE